MTKLSDLNFPLTLDTSTNDIVKDFFNPVLSSSIRYDRGVGFFSAGWLRLTAEGMAEFAKHGGYARWVTSPILSKNDWKALQEGDAARYDKALKRAINVSLDILEEKLEKETLSALAWMVADGILDFKLALPRNKLDHGEFHDKFGIFTDIDGNRVSFNGSYNDSIQGTRNYESIKIFCSWNATIASLVDADVQRFENLWNNEDPNVEVYVLPEAARARIVRLRTMDRPYPAPDNKRTALIQKKNVNCQPRDYQTKAIECWIDNNYRGILEMATGTGKTKTALFALQRIEQKYKKILAVVVAPYKHLVEQWASECERFGYFYVTCSSDFPDWQKKVGNLRMNLVSGSRSSGVLIVTYDTFIKEYFQDALKRFSQTKFIIPDEVHHLGSKSCRISLDIFTLRLGLSATPERIYDKEGTQWLFDNVGPIVFRLKMRDAIPKYLCPYDYHIELVNFTNEEQEDYLDVMNELGKAYARGASLAEEDADQNLQIGPLLRKRQELIGGAKNKLKAISAIVRKIKEEKGISSLNHTLFYSSSSLFDDLQRELSMVHGLKISKFTFSESKEERAQIIENFANARIHAILAKKCLDEGMDIPATQTAFILASSSNPMEFIQRRGRVLRKFPGKNLAVIYDFFVLPPEGYPPNAYDIRLVERELKRTIEFATDARNYVTCTKALLKIKERYNLLHM